MRRTNIPYDLEMVKTATTKKKVDELRGNAVVLLQSLQEKINTLDERGLREFCKDATTLSAKLDAMNLPKEAHYVPNP